MRLERPAGEVHLWPEVISTRPFPALT